ncbi:MAG: CPBP family intramembrane metalloprotease [Caldilineaceae bacterium]|nr:CPBP family intramembrane metalloprotease [Caldilineaceae bacterium]
MNNLLKPFWNPNDKRLRAFWRVILHFLLIFAGLQSTTAVLRPLFSGAGSSSDSGPDPIANMVALLLTGLIYVVVTIAAARFLDRRSFSEYGLVWNTQWRRDLLFGLLLGGFLMGGIFVIELAMGWITIEGMFVTLMPFPFFVAFLIFLVQMTLVGTYEELVFRGYQMKNIAEGLNSGPLSTRTSLFLAWIVTSILFGLIHAANPGATVGTTLKITLAGVFLALPFLLTGELALSIGVHIAWNFFQGNVFGFPVSGLTFFRTTIFNTVQGGPDLWTGGGFGPEAGLLGFIGIIVGSLAMIWWVKRTRGTLDLSLSLAEYRRPPAN